MTDPGFIDQLLEKGKEAKEKVSANFSNLSLEQVNWQPVKTRWSIAQCLDHLIASHKVYFPILKEITDGDYKMNFWGKFSPFTGLWGRLMKNQLQEDVKRKLKAPKKIQPASNADLGIIAQYQQSLDTFLDYISKCRNIDIDKTIIISPVLSIVTYSLRDAFQFLITHEHRHINQAIRVKQNEIFPKVS